MQLGTEPALRQDGEHHVVLDEAVQLPAIILDELKVRSVVSYPLMDNQLPGRVVFADLGWFDLDFGNFLGQHSSILVLMLPMQGGGTSRPK